NSIARIQFLGLEFPQPVLKTAKTLQFGIERKPAEIIRPAIVFMETKPSCKKRARVQVTFDELFRHRAEIGIGVLRGVKRRNDREKDEEDGNKTSYHDLVYAAMKGMLASLDPHSQFMEPDDFRDMQDDTRSRFNGLGIEVSTKNGVLTVVTPMEDTPAAKAGILAGDQILKINGTPTEKLELQQAVNLLRGKPEQKATLTILRPSSK